MIDKDTAGGGRGLSFKGNRVLDMVTRPWVVAVVVFVIVCIRGIDASRRW